MILQRIIFPQNDAAGTLYYKSSKPIEISGKYTASLPSGCRLDLFTYFNALSERRWRTFTVLKSCTLRVTVRGEGVLRLVYHMAAGTTLQNVQEEISFQTTEPGTAVQPGQFGQREAATQPGQSEQPNPAVQPESAAQFSFPVTFSDGKGFYSLEIEAGRHGALLEEAAFETTELPCHEVRLAAVTCAYRREDYVAKNTAMISREILQNPASGLYGRLESFLIDNGQTLRPEQFPFPGVSLISNANTGGSGGFTRGIIEVLRQKETRGFTHVLLMDDDIALDSESLERTYALLCYVRGKYRGAAVGGAMLRDDCPCILEEAGADWPGKLKSLGRGLDLSRREALFEYDRIGNAGTQAWWYCCIPLSIIGPDNLPLPFFIHGDDTEYGLRNFKQVLQLNGVCVWHNTFENKRPSHLEYYDARNQLIVNALCGGVFSFPVQLAVFFKRSTALILRMRYNDILLELRGINDFLKGPGWWGKQDAEALHKEILAAGYRFRELPEGIVAPVPRGKSEAGETIGAAPPVPRLWAALTMNGALLPKKKEAVVVPCGCSPFALYRKQQAYLWDPGNGKAVHVEFSLKKLVRMYALLLKTLIRLIRRYPAVRKAYRAGVGQLGTVGYWERYEVCDGDQITEHPVPERRDM